MKRVLVALAVLSVCTLMRAQSSPTPHDSARSASAKASPASAEKAEAAGKPDVAGKGVVAVKPDAASRPELEDVKPQASPAVSPLVLKDTGAVSTEDVVRGVAQKLAKQEAGEVNGQITDQSSNKAQGGTGSTATMRTHSQNLGQEPTQASDAVMEFQPAPSGSGTASSAGVVLDGAKSKSPRVHGDLYGVAGDAGRAAGGSVGATSKSGKTSVYVQSDQARSKAGQPQ